MKTLILSSEGMRIIDEISKYFSKPKEEFRIGRVVTAAKGEDEDLYIHFYTKKFKELGFNIEDIDIEGKTEDELRDFFRNKDAVWVEGGNTFYLLKAVRESGFDKIIRELLDQGKVYVGVSAGSQIMCPTIETPWMNRDRNTVNLIDLTGLNYIPFTLFVHYKPEDESLIKGAVPKAKYPIKILTDNQALLVQDNKVSLIGDQNEVKL